MFWPGGGGLGGGLSGAAVRTGSPRQVVFGDKRTTTDANLAPRLRGLLMFVVGLTRSGPSGPSRPGGTGPTVCRRRSAARRSSESPAQRSVSRYDSCVMSAQDAVRELVLHFSEMMISKDFPGARRITMRSSAVLVADLTLRFRSHCVNVFVKIWFPFKSISDN